MTTRGLLLACACALAASTACGDDTAESESNSGSGSDATSDSDTAMTTAGPGSDSDSESQTESISGSDTDTAGSTTDNPTTSTTAGTTDPTTSTTTTTTDPTTSTTSGTTDPSTSSSTGEPLMCPDEAPPGFDGMADPACELMPEVGVFDPVVEWTKPNWVDVPNSAAVGMAPVIASMNDDNNDGVIDDADTPDVVLVTFSPGVLRVISGDDGSELVNITGEPLSNQSAVAVGDIDGDNAPEMIVAFNTQLKAFEHDGALKWTSPVYLTTDVGSFGYSPASISDMDNDGTPEIIWGRVILNNDGTTRGIGAFGNGSSFNDLGSQSFAADLDDDGTQEVVVGNALYTPDGATIWNNNLSDGYPAVADFDLDGTPEIVVVHAGNLRLQSSLDGAQIWDVPIPQSMNRGGSPTIADFDGDGEPEIGIAGAQLYTMFDGDGTILWQAPIDDGSSAVTGSTSFDFEGDGVVDIVFADENDLWVFSGVDGSVKLQFGQHSSGTWFEYPVIADVDGDDDVEIIYGSQGQFSGITVIGDAQNSWRQGRKIWNQYDYHLTNVNDDGTIPVNAELNWLSYNNFRSGDLSINDGLAAPDLLLGSEELCEFECVDDLLVLTAHLGNEGASPLTMGATIELYAVVNNMEMLISSVDFMDVLDAGVWTDGFLFEFDPTDVDQLVLRVSAPEMECNTDNNELVIDGPFCQGG